MKKSKYLIVIAGPTSSGKSGIALRLAQELDCPIIGADSRQIYKQINIGTGKPTPEELKLVQHFLIDIISLEENYTAANFEKDVLDILNDYFKTKDIIIMAGGTGLYIKAILEGLDNIPKTREGNRTYYETLLLDKGIEYLQLELKEKDPEYYNFVDLNNPRRLVRALSVIKETGQAFSSYLTGDKTKREFKSIRVLLELPKEALHSNISQRVDKMIDSGLLDEVKALIPKKDLNSLNTVGYKEIFKYYEGSETLEEAVNNIKQNSRRYAKRQMTWFRKYLNAQSFDPREYIKIKNYINKELNCPE